MKRLAGVLLTIFMTAITAVTMAAENREDIHASGDLVQPLLPGMKAPDFTVRTVTGEVFEFKGSALPGPVVLTFFRGGWCPYCNLHLSELRLAEKQLKEMGFTVWFISIDKPESLLDSLDDPDIGYTIFSDSSLDATRAFGLAFHVDDELYKRYQGYGVDLEKASGENHHVLPAPATYIIGPDGIISFAYINPDYKVRLHPDILLAAAKAYMEGADNRLVQRQKEAMKK